jgi:hypothetical protein
MKGEKILRRFNNSVFWGFFILLCLWTVQAQALSIPGLYNTGVDNNNVLLPDSATDPHYSLITSADPFFPGPEAKVAISFGWPFPAWIANGPNSKWIAPRADTGNSNSPGNYYYRTTFDLTGFNPYSAMITGQWTTDNNGLNILINGTGTGFTTPLAAFNQGFFSFSITSGFVAGINTLDFVLFNESGPTGLRVEFLSGSADPIPEPATMLLLGSGLIGLAGYGRRRFKK